MVCVRIQAVIHFWPVEVEPAIAFNQPCSSLEVFLVQAQATVLYLGLSQTDEDMTYESQIAFTLDTICPW